jgi:SAM-dependent methyltransferase
MDPYTEANLAHWDEIVSVHMRSDLYNLDAFKRGGNRLHAIERAELPDVAGKRLLHLQCHFGLDTLSWARLGADVTGIDFSGEAIAQARALSEELDIPARFIQSNLYELPDVLEEEFDVVFTSYGVLGWLPDVARWGEIAASFVRPGGTFYIAEFHPTGFMFDENDPDGFRLKYPYFFSQEPIRLEGQGDYADPDAVLGNSLNFSWIYSMGDVVTALVTNGLRIEFLHEFPSSAFNQFPFLERGSDGLWHIPARLEQIPLVFSIRAVKPGY